VKGGRSRGREKGEEGERGGAGRDLATPASGERVQGGREEGDGRGGGGGER